MFKPLAAMAFALMPVLAASAAMAGQCPADKMMADATKPNATPAKGVTDNVLAAIDGLARAELLPARSAAVLADGYRWLRRAEHALQLAEEQQTAQLPHEGAERIALARRMGYADAEANEALRRFEADLARMRSQVREQFEALVLGSRVQ